MSIGPPPVATPFKPSTVPTLIPVAPSCTLTAAAAPPVLTATVWGDGLIDNPPQHPIARGDIVRFLPFSELTK